MITGSCSEMVPDPDFKSSVAVIECIIIIACRIVHVILLDVPVHLHNFEYNSAYDARSKTGIEVLKLRLLQGHTEKSIYTKTQ